LTAATQYVAAELGPLAKRRVEVVAEPHAGYPGEPRAARPRRRSRALEWLAARAGVAADAWRMRLLWIGEADGVASIIELAPQLQRLGREIPLALRCLCAAGSGLDTLAEGLHEDDPDSLRLSIEAWSPMASAHALAACDLVLVPRPDPRPRSRLIAALLAGRFPVLSSEPLITRRWASLPGWGTTWPKAYAGRFSHPEEVLARLDRAQDYMGRVHAPAAVARGWIEIFRKIA